MIMDETRYVRRSITEDIGRLMAAFPQVLKLEADDPLRLAWIAWKRALLRQIEELEARERHLAGSDHLWIELTRDEAEAAVFGNAEPRDTRADVL